MMENIFEKICSFDNLLTAYKTVSKEHRYKAASLKFYNHLEENLIELQNELLWNLYKLGDFYTFIKYEYFLNTKLFLKLNKKTTIGKISKGVEFVGYKIYPKGKMIKKQTIYKTRRFVNKFLKGEVKAEKFCKSIASMCGHAVHTDNYMFYVRQLLKVIRFLLGCQS